MSAIRGAHGAVRKEVQSGRLVAVKECPANDVARQELAILRELQGHPNIVPLLDAEERDGSLFITMEYIPTTLLSLMQAGRGMDEGQVGSIFVQLLDVVEYMHSKGIVHKDIKLENVLLRDGRIYLIDFGFSTRFVKGAKTLCDDTGSLHYAAPEIWQQLPYEGPSVDVWAMGVALFALSTGYFPFGGKNAQEIYENLHRPLRLPPALSRSAALSSLIVGMLDMSMERRFAIEDIREHPWVAMQLPSKPRHGRSHSLPEQDILEKGHKLSTASATSDAIFCLWTDQPPRTGDSLEEAKRSPRVVAIQEHADSSKKGSWLARLRRAITRKAA